MDLILISYIADLVFGDPQWFPHPVRLIGRLISFLEKALNGSTHKPVRQWFGFPYKPEGNGLSSDRQSHSQSHKAIKRFYGTVVALILVAISGICAYALIELAGKIHPVVGKIAWIFLAYSTLATKDLVIHARAIWKRLSINDIERAREKLSLMVGRDTENLSQDEIIRATVETTAESTTDGIIAPLFYLFLGGPVLAISFKAISTLDSMIGHKNERYFYFGWCAAKIDTIANFIPARITGLLIPVATLFSGKDFAQSVRICFRDGKKQDSLNSAVSEAAMAGALGMRLGGTCSYSGRIVEHPYLGDEWRPMSLALIKEAITISVVASLLMLILGILFKQAVVYLVHL